MYASQPFTKRRVLLGVTGGIASYKSAWLARMLTLAGAEVDVVMSRSALEFVGAITFEALTGRPVYTALVATGHALDHIRLAKAAELVIVAPATADFIARAAQGHADDLLTACLLATTAPVLIVPAMNDRMWAHPQTGRNVSHLREIGYQVLEPEDGPLAAGEGSGPGRMPEPESILAHAGRVLEGETSRFFGRRVLVTAGPTREPIDPVRFLSNRSSGKMGVALAAAAWRRGAVVTLVAGPLDVAPPVGVAVEQVESTEEMASAVRRHLPSADVLIMAAAPADFRAATPSRSKIKKSAAGGTLEIAPAPDILLETRDARKEGTIVVGFALETERAVEGGFGKLKAKDLDLVVVNDATESGAGFGVDTNRVTLVSRDGTEEALPLLQKSEVADAILERVADLMDGR
jgi:phosphopantothenoylcysteine decarboxylase / phosphopantothenate---cysteine ligase